MIAWIWLHAVRAVIRIYPKPFRDRFEAEMVCHIRDQMASSSAKTGWEMGLEAMGNVWDLVACASKAHAHASTKKCMVLLASASGGQAGYVAAAGIDWAWFRRTLPPVLVWAVSLVMGGLLLGLGFYDYGQYWFPGVMGLGLVCTSGTKLYAQAEDYQQFLIANPEEKPRKNAAQIVLVVVALALALIVCVGVEMAASASIAIQVNVSPLSAEDYMGVVGVPALFVTLLVTSALVLTIGGLSMMDLKAYAILGILVLVALGGFAFNAGLSKPGELIAITGMGMLLLGMVFKYTRATRAARRAGFVVALAAHPLVLGFLAALLFDLGFSQADRIERAAALGGGLETPMLRNQAAEYALALARVRHGEAPRVFWETVEKLRAQRVEWGRHKPWQWHLEQRPVGISALRWCQATTGRLDPVKCATLPDPDAWLSSPPPHIPLSKGP